MLVVPSTQKRKYLWTPVLEVTYHWPAADFGPFPCFPLLHSVEFAAADVVEEIVVPWLVHVGHFLFPRRWKRPVGLMDAIALRQSQPWLLFCFLVVREPNTRTQHAFLLFTFVPVGKITYCKLGARASAAPNPLLSMARLSSDSVGKSLWYIYAGKAGFQPTEQFVPVGK